MYVSNGQQRNEQYTWKWLWHRWAPGLWSIIPLAGAYVCFALTTPALFNTPDGTLWSLSGITLLTSFLIALMSRSMGLYIRNAQGAFRHDPVRQGITAAQGAVIVSFFVLPRVGIDHAAWVYGVAFVVLAIISAAMMAFVARPQPKITPRQTLPPPPRVQPRTQRRGAKVAPTWVQNVAKVCVTLSVLAFIRLFTSDQPYFLWGGLAFLVCGVVLPGLVVALGGGQDEHR